MTAQIPDRYRWQGQDYAFVAASAPLDFVPEENGFRPVMVSTACWRGYVCSYEIAEDTLFLRRLEIRCQEDDYPPFDGVLPVREGRGRAVYENLRHRMDYTGSILLGADFLDDYYVHMGIQRAWAYQRVHELVFEHGRLVRTADHCQAVEAIRRRMEEDPDGFFGSPGDGAVLGRDFHAWWI